MRLTAQGQGLLYGTETEIEQAVMHRSQRLDISAQIRDDARFIGLPQLGDTPANVVGLALDP